MEINVTGTNAMTYPNLHIWDWRIAAYLFLGGVTAGLLIMSSIINFRSARLKPKESTTGQIGPIVAPFVLALGMFFISLDLERPLNSFWFYLSFQPRSPMSWGAWGVGIIIPVSFLYGLSALPERFYHALRFETLKRLAARLTPHVRKLAAVNFWLGIFLGIYTGILLSSYVARPLWDSPLLPVLFLASALSTGTAFMIMLSGNAKEKLYLTKVDIRLLVTEIVVLLLFFYGHYASTESSKESILPFFTYTHEFFPYWIAILLLSILLPISLVLKLVEVKDERQGEVPSSAVSRMNLSALMVLVGGFIIRLAIVYAGQLSNLV